MPFIETLESNLWLRFLVDATLKSIVIIAVAGIFGFILRHQSAALRGLVWSLAIVGCLIVPVCSLAFPKWDVGVLPGASGEHESDVLVETSPPPAMPVPIPSRPSPSNVMSPTQVTPSPLQPHLATRESNASQQNLPWTDRTALHWTDWIVVSWAVVGLFLFARLIAGIGAVWYISARSDDFSDAIEHLQFDLERRYRVRRIDTGTVPMVWGFFRPVILLPGDADSWGSERLRAVLLHEFAHIQRRDWLMQTITQIACAVYWFNPLVWVVARRMRTEMEQACDDHVLNAGYCSTEYAQHLLDIVRSITAVGSVSRATVAMARQSKIEGRLRTVLAENRNRHPLTKVAVVIGLLVLIGFAVPMGAMRLAEAVAPEGVLYVEIQNEANRKLEAYPEHLFAVFKSFTAVEADGEIFTGVILSQVGHILVPARVTEAEIIRLKIVDYQPVKVVAVDTESGLGVVQVEGQRHLQPVVLGTVGDLREYAPAPLPNPVDGYLYRVIRAICARGLNLPPGFRQQAVGHPTVQIASIMQLEIDDGGKVTALKTACPGPSGERFQGDLSLRYDRHDVLIHYEGHGEIIRGDALVHYNGRLLAVSLEDKVRYDKWGPSADLIPIDEIRAALERMDALHLIERRIEKPMKKFELVFEAEEFTRLDGVKPNVKPFLTVEDVTASGDAFIVANTALDHQYQLPDSWLTYEIEIPADGDYAIWLYGRGYTGKSDSFFVGTDVESPRACDVNSYGWWGAVPAIQRISVQTVPAFHFTRGKHEIRLFVRETGTELDALLITNDLSLGAAEINRIFTLQNNR